MEGLLAAKRALFSGKVVYAVARGLSEPFNVRIIGIRRERGHYYGLSAADGRWYPIECVRVESNPPSES